MHKLILAAGVAALAIAVPAAGDPGKKGGGHHGGGGHAKVERGGSGHGGGGRQASKLERRGGGEWIKQARAPRFEDRQRFAEQRFERGKRGRDNGFAEVRGKQRERLYAGRTRDEGRYVEHQSSRADGRGGIALRDWRDDNRWGNVAGYSNNCPPGLAKKNNGCLPPGQAKKLIGSVIPAAYAGGYLPSGLRDLYRENDDHYYRYGDGYLYQVDRRSNLVETLLPLFGGGYMVGQQFPADYADYAMPSYYQPFYQDSPEDYYRFSNGYVYDIDRRSGLIENIIPALGYGYGVGEMLPAGYSSYNLPNQYRDVYADQDDYYYRYAPGAIYQVDRDSSLITSVASLLTGGMGVGQPLPAGYSAYNVPYDYRDQYYDTDENWYRYANGNIYQVDPTTQLVTAVIDAIV